MTTGKKAFGIGPDDNWEKAFGIGPNDNWEKAFGLGRNGNAEVPATGSTFPEEVP